MSQKTPPNLPPDDLTPPYQPSEEEFQEFLDKCVEAGMSRGKFFELMDEMWPEDEDEDEEQTND